MVISLAALAAGAIAAAPEVSGAREAGGGDGAPQPARTAVPNATAAAITNTPCLVCRGSSLRKLSPDLQNSIYRSRPRGYPGRGSVSEPRVSSGQATSSSNAMITFMIFPWASSIVW